MTPCRIRSESPSHPTGYRSDPNLPAGRVRSGRGFTLIEILVVISIITVLIGITFVAIKHVKNTIALNSTKVSLQNLNGMLGELDAQNHFARTPATWLWHSVNGGTIAVTSATAAGTDFWHYPFVAGVDASGNPVADTLDAPADVSSGTGPQQDAQRNASIALLNTQLAMQQLAASSVNRGALDKLPAGGKMILTFSSGKVLQLTPPVTAAGSPPVITGGFLKEDGSDSTAAPAYPAGLHLAFQGHTFVGVGGVGLITTAPIAGAITPWYDETASPTAAPLVLDGWGNPIIFVPASGLKVKLLNGLGGYQAANTIQYFIIVSPEGAVVGNHSANPIVTRLGKPFFASAGPDGDFTKGDDNVYSFE